MITENGPITLPNNAALGQGIRVKVASGNLAAAGADDDCIGTMHQASLSTDTLGTVEPYLPPRMGVAADAIVQYAALYRAASGKLSDSADGEAIGIALDAASGDGSIFRWLPFVVRADS